MILSALIDRMIAAGVPAGEAGSIAAEIYAAGVASASFRTSNAARQKRYRDRKAVTNRNETVTPCNADHVTPNVTKRNETVTNRNDVTAPSISLDKKEKKEGRGAQLPDGWRPDEVRWIAACRKLGQDGAERELQKFGSHHRAKGTVFKNWNFAWDKWLLNSEEWGPKKGTAVGAIDTDRVDWPKILESYKRYKNWPKGHGNDPTSPSCRAPPELLEKYGLRTMQ